MLRSNLNLNTMILSTIISLRRDCLLNTRSRRHKKRIEADKVARDTSNVITQILPIPYSDIFLL